MTKEDSVAIQRLPQIGWRGSERGGESTADLSSCAVPTHYCEGIAGPVSERSGLEKSIA